MVKWVKYLLCEFMLYNVGIVILLLIMAGLQVVTALAIKDYQLLCKVCEKKEKSKSGYLREVLLERLAKEEV